MTRVLFSIFVLLFISSVGFCETRVSGNIRSNTVWTKANNPYVLSGTVGVPTAYTLTIEAGVVIERIENYQILVNGSLLINGILGDSVTLKSNPLFTHWSLPFIEFQKSNLSKSNLRFLKFVNGQDGNNIRMGNEYEYSQTSPKNSGTLRIARSNLSNGTTSTQGYNAANSMNIDSSLIASAYLAAYTRAEKINLFNSIVISTNIQSYDTITYNNCHLKLSPMMGTFVFESSKVEECRLTMYNDKSVINNSLFYNTTNTAGQGKLVVQNSKFIVNKQLYDDGGNKVNYLIETGNISISSSELINNSGINYRGITITGNTGYSNTNTVVKNSFNGFYDALYVVNFNSMSADSNNFREISRYHIANYSPNNLYALNNYYELRAGESIDDIILDNDDNLNYGIVNYTPYSTHPVSAAALLPPKNVTKGALGNGVVSVKWERVPQPDSTSSGRSNATGGYKVYWGYIDPFTYSHQITVSGENFEAQLNGASVEDSIAVTAIDTPTLDTTGQQTLRESWYGSARTFYTAPVINTSVSVSAYTFKPVAVDSGFEIFYHDNGTLSAAKVSVFPLHAGDILDFTDQNQITGEYNDTTGILTLTGTASIANYQAAIRSILFRSSSSTPDTSVRTANFVIEDGNAVSNNKTKQITVGKDVTTGITDYFRSRATGNWSDPHVWYSSPNSVTYYPATKSPDENAGIITIYNGHTINLDSDIKTNKITVSSGGALTLTNGVKLTVNQ